MKRRVFVKLIISTIAASASVAQARASDAVIGFLNGGAQTDRPYLTEAYRQALREAGYVEGRNLTIQYRWAENKNERLPGLVAELLRIPVALIAATGGNAPALVAKSATTSVPIVFTNGGDPVEIGVVPSLHHPGANVTGVSWFTNDLSEKRMDLLHDLVPKAKVIALLINPKNPEARRQPDDAHKAAEKLGLKLYVIRATNEAEIDAAFEQLKELKVEGLLVSADPYFTGRRAQLTRLAASYAVPALYANREFVESGGLMSYGNNTLDAYRRAGLYSGRILKGEKPGDLPVDQATKFELFINLRAARTLGVIVPDVLSVMADQIFDAD
jgi:putative ABC transport system substrate-binding protein